VISQVNKLLASSSIIYGSLDSVSVVDADAKQGAFISPLLLLNEHPLITEESHQVEAFGPVSTIMPYRGIEEAIRCQKKERDLFAVL
jgi:oxepin-CoA hydrolase/3-oxo-5,6-dehydrosuberyl-CoA semialdehyde dehydrogenase